MSIELSEAQQKLKSKLKRGDLTRIGKRIGKYRQYVYAVIYGNGYNPEVWKILAEIAQARDNDEKEIIEAAEKLSY